jgi:Fe-S cluster assembly protein SufD
MIAVREELDFYLAAFEEIQKPDQPAWLRRLRRAAIDRFGENGFPTTALEEWKFTSVAPIARTVFRRVEHPPALASLPFPDLGCPRLVFVNGRYSPALSRPPDGGTAMSLREAIGRAPAEEHLARYARGDHSAFTDLNTALFTDGAFVEIPRDTVVSEPLELLYVTAAEGEPVVTCPRTLIVAGRGCQARFIETHRSLGEGVHFTNAVTEIVAGENAVVEHYKLQQQNSRSFHVATVEGHQDRASSLHLDNLSLGAALARNDTGAVLDAEGAECVLDGLYVASAGQHVDHHTTLDHARPHCSSREVYKGVLDGRASAVFNGKIIVRKDAQKTDSKQTNKNLLLSENATVTTKPQLEIYADDVKCTHGATIGQLGEEAIFYLRSRGIGREDARSLLTYAFASEMLGRISFEPLRNGLDALLQEWLRHGR